MLRFFRRESVTPREARLFQVTGKEQCFYVETSRELNPDEVDILAWHLAETFDPSGFELDQSSLEHSLEVIEVGPRLHFETPWGSTARDICEKVGLDIVTRLERSIRYGFDQLLSSSKRRQILEHICDRMTEMVYDAPLQSFGTPHDPEPVRHVPVLAEGRSALESANKDFGLSMDDHDVDTLMALYAELGRDPTDVELFAYGQGNSEHSRHGFFRGELVIDGVPQPHTLMHIVKAPWRANPNNSVIAFNDDSSAIRGQESFGITVVSPEHLSLLSLNFRTLHPTLTAETHNFPTGVAPYPGAATGTGGRIRDNQCVGRGGLVGASLVGYCTADPIDTDRPTPAGLASPLDILIHGSNGAIDYGNCFGEPIIGGHVRTFSMRMPDGTYRAWFKPILYSAGVGLIDDRHIIKQEPDAGMLMVQLGGPAYRIGMGGSAASSRVSDESTAELDFDAVQRGAPEMEQRLNRVIRACIEMGDDNPILSAHDLGAGGDSNALPELMYPAGGQVELRSIPVADSTLSVLEIWGNESQERNVFLADVNGYLTLQQLSAREGVPCAIVGTITGDGLLVVYDDLDDTTLVNLPLEPLLGDVPPKRIELTTEPLATAPLVLPEDFDVAEALTKVLALPGVGSKEWVVSKGDRSVTGLVAQQQGVGPNDTPISNYAILAHSYFDKTGTAVSQGERPLLGLISPAAQGRMSVAEAICNLMGVVTKAPGSSLNWAPLANVSSSANWMWAAKEAGEGSRLYEAAIAMSNIMLELGMIIDGGKDSLSMAVRDAGETIKAPGQLVIAPYAFVPDVTRKVTPDLKSAGNWLLFIDLANGHTRLGGSALAQVYEQIGNDCPDVENVSQLGEVFELVQDLIRDKQIVSLHDRSDGGLIVTLLEMAIAGNLGLWAKQPYDGPDWFSEELGLVIEVKSDQVGSVAKAFWGKKLPCEFLGIVQAPDNGLVLEDQNEAVVWESTVHDARAAWSAVSRRLEVEQSDLATQEMLAKPLEIPEWHLSFHPAWPGKLESTVSKPRRHNVAVLRHTGTNGDREMAAAFMAVGFEVHDITMSDLLSGDASLEDMRGVAFPGGFANADVLDAGKAWAGMIKHHPRLNEEFSRFYERPDTFSLGVCNGAQVMALLGWVPGGASDIRDASQPRFIRNQSGRFESRFPTVHINQSRAIMLQGMAGSQLGVWSAHAEGYLHFPDSTVGNRVVSEGLAPISFVDADGPTESYPANPNGSYYGLTALCSENGRHLATMVHLERLANALWQWPWFPESWKDFRASPWLKPFQNAYAWCENHQSNRISTLQ